MLSLAVGHALALQQKEKQEEAEKAEEGREEGGREGGSPVNVLGGVLCQVMKWGGFGEWWKWEGGREGWVGGGHSLFTHFFYLHVYNF